MLSPGWKTAHFFLVKSQYSMLRLWYFAGLIGCWKFMPISLISTTSTRYSSRHGHLNHSSGMKSLIQFLILFHLLYPCRAMGVWVPPLYYFKSRTNSSRDPWWLFTTASLFWTIKRQYNFKLWELILVSPRFGVMLASMCLSIIFIIVDTCSVLNAFKSSELPTGVEPFWKVDPTISSAYSFNLQYET